MQSFNSMTDRDARAFAPVVLRLGLAALFLWFGFSQVFEPSAWISWLPVWAANLTWISPTGLVLFNGWFEIILGVMLAVGLLTRWVALLLSLHLFVIAYEVGYNDIGVRDFVLAVSTLVLSLGGADWLTLDKRMTS